MPRASNTDERRQQIARAFLKVMAHHGYDGTSIAEVARKAKLAPGLVHYHFENKLEILLAATRELLAEHRALLHEALARAAASASPSASPSRATRPKRGQPAPAAAAVAARGNPPAELVAFLDVHLGLGAHSNPDALAFWVQLGGEAQRQKKVRAELVAALTLTAERLADIVRRGVATGDFRCDDPRAAAAALLAAVEGYFVLATNARALVPAGSAAASAARMAEGLLQSQLPPLPAADSAVHSTAGSTARPPPSARARSAHD